jgi:UDP-glucose:glycoprotein glucosyltransferase
LIKGKKQPFFNQAKFEAAIKGLEVREGRSAEDISLILNGEPSQNRISDTEHYLARLGIDQNSPLLLVNGVVIPRNDGWLQAMSTRVDLDLRALQREVFEGTISEETWESYYFLQGAITHRNALIIPEDESAIKVHDIGSIIVQHRHIYSRLPRIAASDDSLKQFWSHIIVVVDLDSPEGLQLIIEALEFRKQQPEAELILLHNPSNKNKLNMRSASLFKLLLEDNDLTPDSVITAITGDGPSLAGINLGTPHEMAESFWVASQPLSASLGLEPGCNGIVLNGRLVGPIPASMSFSHTDFLRLLEFERSKRITPANTALTALSLEDRLDAPVAAAKVSSLIALSMVSDLPEGMFDSSSSIRINTFEKWSAKHTAILTGDPEQALLRIVASIDPTSEVAQRWIPILKVLSELNGVHMKLFLNPRERMQELPVKRFYRHVLDAKPSFSEDGSRIQPRATFDGLPREALLNLGLDVPPAWLVAPKESIHDLDNIKLSAIKDGSDIDAVYELEHILIEGHSRDVTLGSAPRGVQLLLGTEKDPHYADTLIMANLGYFQFKANPGYWNIELQAGRSQQIYNIDSIGSKGYAPQPGDDTTEVALMSFQGKTLFPRLSRKPGQELEDVLEEYKAGSAMDYVSKATKFASSFLSNVGLTTKSAHADINIFSVASGHLYERMLNIMMVSVMRHTKHSVKFWFIEQFLSPSFKTSVPYLAAHYNFSYEMVTYKWPHWLRAQKEKQREIWGYKILFLDVLFPLSLDKVIFVDADQIVRTDMYELVTHDLEGAPYGFTPMCDSRTEMEGFRFWKQGYWKNFLRGLPYHISALYVVDLARFRQLAAGDRLRQQYHQLSADPASLSNLDQDLPNHMQMVLPIHSLPQEWLWCETWCSDEALGKARTIDLCNNPLTKEPKLDRARRQVPEWNIYDQEISEVLKKAMAKEGEGGEGRLEGVDRFKGVQEELDRVAGEAAKKARDEL